MNRAFQSLSAEALNAIQQLSATLEPALNAIHAETPTTQNYYGDYMAILGSAKEPAKIKLLALAMLYSGANPDGVEAAVEILCA